MKMEPCKIWIEKCAAARMIEDGFGTDKALTYLIGEKFLDYLDAAERLPDFRAEVHAFVAEIRMIFELLQLEEFLRTARRPSRSIRASVMTMKTWGRGRQDGAPNGSPPFRCRSLAC